MLFLAIGCSLDAFDAEGPEVRPQARVEQGSTETEATWSSTPSTTTFEATKGGDTGLTGTSGEELDLCGSPLSLENVLVTLDTASGYAWSLDPLDGAATQLGRLPPSWDGQIVNNGTFREDGLIYTKNGSDGWLYLLDPCTGGATPVLEVSGNFCGIARDPRTDTVYGVIGNSLYELLPTSSQVTRIGAIDRTIGNCGLSWDCQAHRLILADSDTDAIYELDTATGATTWLADTGVPWGSIGMEYDPKSDAIITLSDRDLYTFSVSTGATTLLGVEVVSHGDDLALHVGPLACTSSGGTGP